MRSWCLVRRLVDIVSWTWLFDALDWFAGFAEPTHIHTNILLALARLRIRHTPSLIILLVPIHWRLASIEMLTL